MTTRGHDGTKRAAPKGAMTADQAAILHASSRLQRRARAHGPLLLVALQELARASVVQGSMKRTDYEPWKARLEAAIANAQALIGRVEGGT